jgi:hypothetical protein
MENYNPMMMPLLVNDNLIKEDGSDDADAMEYRSLIGSFLYLITTKFDIMYASRLLFRFMHQQSQIYFRVAKRVLRYVQGSK